MKNSYQGRTTDTGTIEGRYENGVYNFAISKDSAGHLQGNFTKKTEDFNVIMNQLMQDLSEATVKLETLVGFIGDIQKTGLISAELYEKMLGFVHDGAYQEESSKSR